MQGGKDQVTGLGGGHGQADGLQIAQLAHQDGVWVFAQGGAQGGGKRMRHRTDLALIHEALARFVHEFDRVFDGEDVARLGVIEVMHHGGQRGGLA